MSLPGVDLASFQGLPANWRAAAGAIAFAAVKITEHKTDGSTYLNPDAAADWAFLGEQGKSRIGYTFGHPGSSAANTAASFAAAIGHLGLRDGDGVALDLEVTDGRSPASVAAWAREVTAELTRTLGRPVVLYTFLSFAESGNCAGLGHLPLWIADPSSPAGRPRVPAPWKSWVIHQHSISGAIDRDLAGYPTIAAMQAALGKHHAPAKGPTVIKHVTEGGLSLAGLADKHGHGATPLGILRLTAQHSPGGVFPGSVAAYGNGVFRGTIKPGEHMPAGLHLYLPA